CDRIDRTAAARRGRQRRWRGPYGASERPPARRAARLPADRRRVDDGLPCTAIEDSRAGAASFRRLWRAAWVVRACRRQAPRDDQRLDANGEEATGRRIQELPAHALP